MRRHTCIVAAIVVSTLMAAGLMAQPPAARNAAAASSQAAAPVRPAASARSAAFDLARLSAVDKVIETANAREKPWGIPVGTLPDLERYLGRGGLVMVLGGDTRLLRMGTMELMNGARALLEKKAATS